ncbi:hypothetical protein [Pontibacter pamirensis]|uniref:hypothetical protein n=1 Tax=Pontibacter pamirensis TaxID=2562824 RepID=UPI001389E328|nr:hypothetical protein [Pontibacter pamirensis]
MKKTLFVAAAVIAFSFSACSEDNIANTEHHEEMHDEEVHSDEMDSEEMHDEEVHEEKMAH